MEISTDCYVESCKPGPLKGKHVSNRHLNTRGESDRKCNVMLAKQEVILDYFSLICKQEVIFLIRNCRSISPHAFKSFESIFSFMKCPNPETVIILTGLAGQDHWSSANQQTGELKLKLKLK